MRSLPALKYAPAQMWGRPAIGKVSRMRSAILCLSSLFVFFNLGCDDPPPAPNKPIVVGAEAKCRVVEDVPKLVSVTVRVHDLDGVSDLQMPIAIVEATALPMEMTPTGDEVVPGCKDADGQCEATFTWERSRDSAQIYCGESLDGLELKVRVLDQAGFKRDIIVSTQPQ